MAVCDGFGEHGAVAAERVSVGRESYSPGRVADEPAVEHPERAVLGEIGKWPGRKVMGEVACAAKPDTILAWYRRLVAKRFDGSKHRQYPAARRASQSLHLVSPSGD